MAAISQQAAEPPESDRITPIPKSERSLAPDIARGAMLLFIAVANVGIYLYLYGRPLDDHGHLTDASLTDRVALFVEQLLMADRSRPMFAILYGFGIAVMASRMFARGMDGKGVRKILRRRGWWLILFGFLHAALLFHGDILAPYGATGLIALFFVHLSTKALKRWLWASSIYFVVAGLLLSGIIDSARDGFPEPDLTTYGGQLLHGAIESASVTTAVAVTMWFLPLAIIGMMIQRGGWIDHPDRHLPQLRRVFYSGMAVNLATALPVALVGLGAWHPTETVHAIAGIVTFLGGMYAGLGYICGFALLAHRWSARGRRGVPGALAAVGERSLTCYLTLSIIMSPLLAPWGLGLSENMSYLAAYGVAVGAWAVTVGLSVLMDRAGKRGPFEVVLRRLTYGRKRSDTFLTRTPPGLR